MTALFDQYRLLLAEGIIPFWMRALDDEFGGVFSCMSETGTILSTEKYTWSQARFAWTLSALYNRFEPRPEFIAHARKTIDFLLRYGRDDSGRFVYRTTREGAHLEGATSIYSDCFVAYGITEYCRAVPDDELRRAADDILQRVKLRVEEPVNFDIANKHSFPRPRLAFEVDAQLVANEALPAVAGNQILNSDLFVPWQHSDE